MAKIWLYTQTMSKFGKERSFVVKTPKSLSKLFRKRTESNNSTQNTLLLQFCEYKILPFWSSDDFGGINFCDIPRLSSILRIRATKYKRLTLKLTGLLNVAMSTLKLLQFKYIESSRRFMYNMPHGAAWACTNYPVRTRFKFCAWHSNCHRNLQPSLSWARDGMGRKKRERRNDQKRTIMHAPNWKTSRSLWLYTPECLMCL